MRQIPLSRRSALSLLTVLLVALPCGQSAAAEVNSAKVAETDVGGVEAPEIPLDLAPEIPLELAPKFARDLVVAGYLRALSGLNSEGSRAACFQLVGSQAKYRLGNECEVYGELLRHLRRRQPGFGDRPAIRRLVVSPAGTAAGPQAALAGKPPAALATPAIPPLLAGRQAD